MGAAVIHGRAMEPEAFFARVREHYVEQFAAFVEAQREAFGRGQPEVKLKLGQGSGLYGQLYCVDFLGADEDGQPRVVELEPQRVLTFDRFESPFGRAQLGVTNLRWDDVLIYHDAEAVEPDALDAWFGRWFDPEDLRHAANAPLGEVIHSLLVRPGAVSVDFGTARVEAFWELLRLVEASGAQKIEITSSKAEAAAAG